MICVRVGAAKVPETEYGPDMERCPERQIFFKYPAKSDTVY